MRTQRESAPEVDPGTKISLPQLGVEPASVACQPDVLKAWLPSSLILPIGSAGDSLVSLAEGDGNSPVSLEGDRNSPVSLEGDMDSPVSPGEGDMDSPVSLGKGDVALVGQAVQFCGLSLHPGHKADTRVLMPASLGYQHLGTSCRAHR